MAPDKKLPGYQVSGGASRSGPRRLGDQTGGPRSPSVGAERRRARRRGSRWMGWGAVGIVVAVAVVLVALFANSSTEKPNSDSSSNGVATGRKPLPAPPAYVRAITTIPAATFNSVGVNSLEVPFTVTKDQPRLTSNSKPEFVYEGGEYCPYCAMMRYSLIAALSRFGTFAHLKETTSASDDGNIPTFSFLGSTYTSKYVSFSPWETLDREQQPLQNPPRYVSKLYAKYDGSPTTGAASQTFNPGGRAGIPFLDIGNKYVSAGDPAPFDSLWRPGDPLYNGGPGRLAIAHGIHNPDSSTGKYVDGPLFLAQANYISGAICSLDGGKPRAVCDSSGVLAVNRALAKAPQVG